MTHSAEKMAPALVCVCLLFAALSCRKTAAPPSGPTSSAQPSPSAFQRFQLVGQVVSIDKQSKMANVDSQAIPGFMDAMTMPYVVKSETELDRLTPGDHITADVVIGDGSVWLEKVVVTAHPGKAASK
ncbi:MAG: copper-binding protein [Acidobacteria bacterium]|nr:copper-binding protein [Acidobacteriota bacterium]